MQPTAPVPPSVPPSVPSSSPGSIPPATTAPQGDNPLLFRGGPPRFDLIRPEHVEPAVAALLAEVEADLAELEAKATPTWQGLVEPLERLHDKLEACWGTVEHLLAVRNAPELRAAHEAMQPAVVAFSMRLGQSEPVYQAFKGLREGPDWQRLDGAQRRVVESALRDAVLSGVALQGEARTRFNAIQTEMAELSTKFSNHVLDATKAWGLDLLTTADVEGLPQSLLHLAAQTWRDHHGQPDVPATGADGQPTDDLDHGPWRITLDFPSYGPFLQHSRRRDLREELYRAYITRASEGEFDNQPLIDRILALRLEMARLLGFTDFAAVSLYSKMAGDTDKVQHLLEELRRAAYGAGLRDLQELRDYARSCNADEAEDLRQWDIAYWAERLREARYDFNDELLRPYFPLPKVLDGLFALARRLFGVEVRPADGEAPVWHADVRFFRIFDEAGQPVAAFYLDAFSRPAEKRGGAWMNECLSRSRLFGTPEQPVRLPIAYLVCNQTPPVGKQPSLMTFREVETLFHEFGHGLQHMLTRVDVGLCSGIRNIEWDAVELPSQFMENWCYHKPSLQALSGHVDTGEPLPDALFVKIEAARTYRAGTDMLRQLLFALTDLKLHHGFDPTQPVAAGTAGADGIPTPFTVYRHEAERTLVLAPLPEDRFLCSFTHIFAGGYAAGYYSYKWAEVLASDAFAAFEEAGLDDEAAIAQVGRRFRDTVLALGGSQHPMEVFRAFRGREPSTEALLRHAGLRNREAA